jgi:hypothetical protein
MFWFLPKAYPIEIVHCFFALIGFIANVLTLTLAAGDLQFIRLHSINGFKLFMARKNIVEEGSRCVINTLFLAIGIVSILNEPPTHFGSAVPEAFQLVFTRVVLTGASLTLTFKSVKDLVDRYRLQNMMHLKYDRQHTLGEVREKAEEIVEIIDKGNIK